MNIPRPTSPLGILPRLLPFPNPAVSVPLFLLILFTSIRHASAAPQADTVEFFESEIRPLFIEYCHECHSGSRLKGQLNLESRQSLLQGGESGPAIVPGDPDASLLIQAVRYDGLEMPPDRRLPEAKVRHLEAWIRQQAPWPDTGTPAAANRRPLPTQVTEEDRRHWAFQPPRATLPADVQPGQHPIDVFVDLKLSAESLAALPQAEPQVLVRRAFLNLTGLPPTFAELNDWTQRIAGPAAGQLNEQGFAAMLDDLLARPAYAEHWARHWLDVVRFGQSNVYERDGYKPYSWRYRDYVVQSLLLDKPWDRFLVEQLAGDELPDSTGETRTATGFYRVGVWDDEADDQRQAEFDDLDDVLVTVGSSMLGLTIGCARCHDHKFDPLPQTDYYRLLSFFRGIRRYENPEDKATSATVLPLEDAGAVRRFLQPPQGEQPRRLTWTLAVRESGVVPPETRVLVRGQAANPTASVFSAFPQVLCRADNAEADRLLLSEMHSQSPLADVFPSSGRRLAFARWLVRRDHPLTARVAVNRVWHLHFGRGLAVATGDFGRAAEPPLHQPLLDWLAVDFMDHGWSMKQLHRRILTSATWRRASRLTGIDADSLQQALDRDPAGQLLWRFPIRRLQAESIRDRLLFSSGELNAEVGGPEMYPQLSGEVLAGQSKPGLGWQTSSPRDQCRRSLYAIVKRGVRDPLLEALDYTNTASPLTERPVTTVAPQALILLHGRFTAERAEALAKQVVSAATAEAQVQEIYQRILQRRPTPSELRAALELVAAYEQQLPLESEQISFRPDVPESLYSPFRQQLPEDAFLLGPRETWEYHRGVWGGGYEGIDVVDKRLGPHAFWMGRQLRQGVLSGKLQMDASTQSVTLLAAARPAGAAWSGPGLTFDRSAGQIQLRFRHTSGTEELLSAADWTTGDQTWISFRWEIGTEIKVFLDGQQNPLISASISPEKLKPGYVGVAVWGGRLDLRELMWNDSDNSSAPLHLLIHRSRRTVATAPPGWSRFGGTWQRLTDTSWQVAADRGGKILWDQHALTAGEVSVELRMPAGQAEIGGLLLCVSEPDIGPDNWYGYEVSLNIPAKAVLLGDHRHNFRLLQQQSADVAADRWHLLRAVLQGERLQVYLDQHEQPLIDQPLTDRLQGGLAGLRTWGSEIEFRNFRIRPSDQSSEAVAAWPVESLQPLPALDHALQRRQQGLAALCRTMFSLSEFAYSE
ncbi:MAG: DUF1553 domain-containing protein [Planctomycetaceae bacterium]